MLTLVAARGAVHGDYQTGCGGLQPTIPPELCMVTA